MTTMVERVARALHEKMCEQDVNGYLAAQLEAADLARAAIEALMEPTEDMLDAGDAADGYDVYVGVWTAMIQAALKEGQ